MRLLAGAALPEAFPPSDVLVAEGVWSEGSLARVVASDMRESLRECPGLDEGRLESRVDSDRLKDVSACWSREELRRVEDGGRARFVVSWSLLATPPSAVACNPVGVNL